MLDLEAIKSTEELLQKAKCLEGKTLRQIRPDIVDSDKESRVKSKGAAGYAIEEGFFGIKPNSRGEPDIPRLGVEIKTCPLKCNPSNGMLAVKEPLSLNMIDYMEEYKSGDIAHSSFYKKNKLTLFVCYIHDKSKKRSEYPVKYVFYWKIDHGVIAELTPDYNEIIGLIKAGRARDIHQKDNEYLTLCPKHNGKFKDPNEPTSKVNQPFSSTKAEKKAFRLKTVYVAKIICRHLGVEPTKIGRGYWWRA